MNELIAVPELRAQGTKTVLVLSPGLGEVDVVIIHEIASSLYNLEVEKYKNHSLKLVFENTGSEMKMEMNKQMTSEKFCA